MNCPSCGSDNRESARFCDSCGGPLALRCTSCQAELRSGARFCDACGASVGGLEAATAGQPPAPAPAPVPTLGGQPTSFANGRYQVTQLLGEGGKKKVYLAHDTLLDREVAFALIKTEGLDETSRTVSRRKGVASPRSASTRFSACLTGSGFHRMGIFHLFTPRACRTGTGPPLRLAAAAPQTR